MKTLKDRSKTQKGPENTVPAAAWNRAQLHALLYDALETEQVGVLVYQAALRCAINEELATEWEKYLRETQNHVEILTEVLRKFGLNPDQDTPGRSSVRYLGQSLARTIELAQATGQAPAAQIVAAECIIHAESKDHMNWELLGVACESLGGTEQEILKTAFDEVEQEEDEHLYHTKGWARELHLEALGLPAELPPAEERKDVTTALDAATVVKERKRALTGRKKRAS